MVYDPNQPYATNDFAARGNFVNREVYKEHSYPHQPWDVKPIDLWYTHTFYGKMDNLKNALEPKKSQLVLVPSDKSDDIKVLNFVADAFKDLRDYINAAGVKNVIETEKTEYYDLQPKLGWLDAEINYDEYLQLVYDAFFEGFMAEKEINEKLVSFASFLKLFAIFFERMVPQFGMTKTSFILSAQCSPMSSGLMLEMSEQLHGDDKNKYDKFIKDKNFDFFTIATQKFGFVIDKNAPWRIIADLSSAPMQKYMRRYNLTLDTLFQISYTPTYLTEIETLKQYLVKFYNAYSTARPEVRITKPSDTNRRGLSTMIYKRVLIDSIDSIEFDDMYWLKYYAYIRAKELDRNWRQVTFNRMIETARQLNRFKNYSSALEFLHKRLRGPQPEFKPLTSRDQHDKINLQILNKSQTSQFRLF